MTVRIVTDSTCDLPADIIERYGVRVVPLYINVGNQGYLDGIDITREEFYRKLPDFPEHPTTAVPSMQKFLAMYDSLVDEGATAVLSIHISIALSATVEIARSAAQETTSVPVIVFDSRQLSMGTGFMVEEAAKMAANGKTVEEILHVLNQQVKRTHVFAALDTLEFLKRSGRMNRYITGLGTFLQLKPILTMFDGKPGTERVRTRARATKRVVEMLAGLGKTERVAFLHTNAAERVAELKELAAPFLPAGDVPVADITPVIGAHIGPGAYGFAVVTA